MFERPVQRLIDHLTRLPGVGRKSAQRLAFHLLNIEESDARALAQAIVDLREQTSFCTRCFNVTSGVECSICLDPRRESHVICVVERAQDIAVVERTREFRGHYHVLGGALSPIDGIGLSQLRIEELHRRLLEELATVDATANHHYQVVVPSGRTKGQGLRSGQDGEEASPSSMVEVIVATNPTIEGDTTAMYLARRFKPLGVTVTRPASGLPVGGDMDYADEITLGRALTGRQRL